jgi:hypothetical protein
MNDKVVKTICSIDGRQRVNFIQKSNNTFYFEEEYFSENPLEMSWISSGRQSLSICDSLESAIQEAKSRIAWLEKQ